MAPAPAQASPAAVALSPPAVAANSLGDEGRTHLANVGIDTSQELIQHRCIHTLQRSHLSW